MHHIALCSDLFSEIYMYVSCLYRNENMCIQLVIRRLRVLSLPGLATLFCGH